MEKRLKIEYDNKYILCVYETDKIGDRELELLVDVVAVAPKGHPEILAQGFGMIMTKLSYSTIRKVHLPENAPHRFQWVSRIPQNAIVICKLVETCGSHANPPYNIYLVAIPVNTQF